MTRKCPQNSRLQTALSFVFRVPKKVLGDPRRKRVTPKRPPAVVPPNPPPQRCGAFLAPFLSSSRCIVSVPSDAWKILMPVVCFYPSWPLFRFF